MGMRLRRLEKSWAQRFQRWLRSLVHILLVFATPSVVQVLAATQELARNPGFLGPPRPAESQSAFFTGTPEIYIFFQGLL